MLIPVPKAGSAADLKSEPSTGRAADSAEFGSIGGKA
jgi:hypothetical protein